MIGTLLEKLFVSVGVDLTGLGQGMADATREVSRLSDDLKKDFAKVGESWKATGEKMVKVGAVMSAGITAPLTYFGKKAAEAAIDAAEMESAFDVVFGNMSASVRKWAEETGNAMGRSTQELQRGALAFQELFGKSLDPAKAAEMSKTFAVLTQDLSSFKNISGEVAQQKLFSGLIGEAEPLRSVGVFLSESAVQAKALSLGLKANAKDLTDGDKIIARAALIREQLAAANGDVIRTGDSAANQIRASQAAYEELSITVGTVLIPAITPLIKIVGDLLNGFNKLDPGLQTFIIGAAAVAAAVGPILTGFGAVVTIGGALLPVLGAAIPILAGVAGAFGGLLVVLAPILLPLAAIAGAVALVYATWKHWDQITAFVARLYNGVKTYLQDKLAAVFTWLQDKLKAVGGWFYDLYDAVVGHSYIPDMVDEIGANMARLQALMVDPARKATKSTGEAFRALAGEVGSVLDRLFPLQAQLKSILADIATLEKAKAAGQIDAGTYDAARAKLDAERRSVQDQITPPVMARMEGAIPAVKVSLDDFMATLGKLPPIATEAQLALQDFGERLGDGIMASIRDVLSGRGNLNDVVRDMLSRFFERTITTALRSLETSIFGEGGLGGFLGGLFSKVISGRAVGGPVMPGRAYTVGMGEQFVPSQSGRVLSRNDAMRAMGGGSGGRILMIQVDKSDYFDVKVREAAAPVVQDGIGRYDRIVGDRADNSFKRRG